MKPKILIVDDDLVVLKMLSRALREPYQLMVLPTGYDLQEMVNHFQPNLIILDVGLPEEDGFKLCRELRMLSDNNAIAILFLSGLGSANVAATALSVGGDAFLAKPFDLGVLKTTMDDLISQKRSAGPSLVY